ncbi:unnamed protein product [Bemisia tabaci]|uniref:cholesterol 7-desaturase n=1 Tax=Bemisia tabaci TaxID=7038 RepID=A0A9P0A2Z0_BEMTA|nr:unnamed protein product [Bemisia tabaci]
MGNYIGCHWIENITRSIMVFITLLNQPWALMFIFIAFSASFVYLIFYRPVTVYRDLTGIKSDLRFNVASSETMVRQRFLKRARQENENPSKSIPMYANGWTFLCHSDEVRTNCVKYIEALGEDFAVFRKSNGKVHVVNAYCPHLGANMGVGGIVKDDCLQCPFHGWRFDGDTGKCKSIPYTDKVPRLAKVQAWKCCEVNHMIFVWYHAEGEEPTYEIPPVDEIMSGKYSLAGKCEYLINGSIGDLSHGSADLEHFQAIHAPPWLRDRTFAPDKSFSLRHSLRLIVKMEEWTVHHTEPHRALSKTCLHLNILDRITVLSFRASVKWINAGHFETEINISTLKMNAHMKLLTCITPVGPAIQRVVTVHYCHPLLVPLNRLVFRLFLCTFEEDVKIYNYKKIHPNVIITKEEDVYVKWKRWHSQFFSKNSPQLKIQTELSSW